MKKRELKRRIRKLERRVEQLEQADAISTIRFEVHPGTSPFPYHVDTVPPSFAPTTVGPFVGPLGNLYEVSGDAMTVGEGRWTISTN